MIAYRKEGRLLYITEPKEKNQVHHVPIIHWDEYMKLRKVKPILCKIYNTIKEAYEGAEDLPVSHIYTNYVPKKKEYEQGWLVLR